MLRKFGFGGCCCVGRFVLSSLGRALSAHVLNACVFVTSPPVCLHDRCPFAFSPHFRSKLMAEVCLYICFS